jgi:DNA-binding YbaB/EbfC family protein
MAALMKQAQKVQEEIKKVQDNLENITVEASSGGGMVKVTANCKLQILSISIEPQIYEEDDKEMMEDLVIAAVNQAITTAQQRANEEMEKVTGGLLGGMNLPGGFKLPGM